MPPAPPTAVAVPLGRLSLYGSPNSAWAQTPNPLLVEQAAVAAYLAGLRSLTRSEPAGWVSLAPGVRRPPQLVGAQDPAYLSPLEVSLGAEGSEAQSVILRATVSVSGGNDPGRYDLTVVESIASGVLTIGSWTMASVGE